MSSPLVSLLIPCYNGAATLAATLDSAVAQTWPHREIIVVDDGSRDESAAIARRYADRGVILISQRNAGQSAAFNTALRAARGDYFEYLDADDLLASDKIALQLAHLARHPAGTVCTGAWARFRTDPTAADFSREPVWPDLAPVDWLISFWGRSRMMHGAAWLVPRAVAERAGPWTESLSLINDFDYFARVVLASTRVTYCGAARSYYRSGNTGSLSHASSPRAIRSAFDAMTLGTAALLRVEDSPRTRAACAVPWQSFVHTYYPDCPDLLRRAERHVRDLGGCSDRAPGGAAFLFLSRLIGWKAARRLQRLGLRLRASRRSP